MALICSLVRFSIMFTMRHLEILAAIFFIWIGLWFFFASMSALSDHEIWLATFGFFFFFFLCSIFFVVFLCFSVGISGAWHYGHHKVTMTGKGFWMLLRLGSWIKKESRFSGSGHWCFMGKVNWDPTIISVSTCIRYSNSVATTICVAKTPIFFSSFLRLCLFGTISMISLSIIKLKPPKIRKRN